MSPKSDMSNMTHLIFEICNKFLIALCNQQIIYIDRNNDKFSNFCSFNIQNRLIFASDKATIDKMSIHFPVPCSWGLFKAIQSLIKSVNIILLALNLKPLRLFNIQSFLQFSIKKCRLYIKMKHLPSSQSYKCPQQSYSFMAYHKCKDISKIHTMLLKIPF